MRIFGEKPIDTIKYELKKHAVATVDERPDDNLFKLIVKFIVPDKTVRNC